MQSTSIHALTNPAVHNIRLPHELQEGRVVHQPTAPLTGGLQQLVQFLLQASNPLSDAVFIVVTLQSIASMRKRSSSQRRQMHRETLSILKYQ